jgi:hypothetical protein
LQKHRLRNKLLLYGGLLLVPMILGGACGVIPYLVPEQRTFGESEEAERAARDKKPALGRHCLTGAAVGGIVGAGACGVVTWANRKKKRRLFE